MLNRVVTRGLAWRHPRPLAEGALRQLQKFYEVELTYTSNTIEGNALTHRETAEVIEHCVTVGAGGREHGV
jgi:hypothetical protein